MAEGFSFDEFFDPIIREQANEFEESVPRVLRGAYRRLANRLIEFSIDGAVKSLIERLLAEWLDTDRSQPFEGFALSRMTDADGDAVEQVGLDPITIITIIGYAIQVIEWLRKRRNPVALAASAPGSIVEGRVVSAMLLTPDLTLTIGEGLKIS